MRRGKIRHVELRYHFIKEMITNKSIEIKYIREYNTIRAYQAGDDSYFVNDNLFELDNSLFDYMPRISDTSIAENDSTEFWFESIQN